MQNLGQKMRREETAFQYINEMSTKERRYEVCTEKGRY
jgi:hypothetical protein